MKNLIMILSFILSLSLSANEVEYVKDSAVYIGNVEIPKTCEGKEAQVFFVNQSVVNYQIPVPRQGEFQVHLIPGDYQVVAIDKGGCIAEKFIQVEANKVLKQDLKLESLDTVSMQDILGIIFPNAYAMSMCIQCLQGSQYGAMPNQRPYFGGYPSNRFGYPTPYWGPFGHFSFNRFSSPCPMGGLYPGAYAVLEKEKSNRSPAGMGMAASSRFTSGCMGNKYPGGGGAVMGKPNVYFHGEKGTKIKFSIGLKNNANIIASTPITRTTPAEYQLNGEGGIVQGKANYPYMFYDVRTNLKGIQETQGRCVESSKVLSTMVEFLKDAGFNKRELKDFHSYWSIKLPKLPKVCIYPQTNEQLLEISELKISPKPKYITRMIFMLVPIIDGKFPKHHFSKLPQSDWKQPEGLRAPASNSLTIREWGVGFLTIPEVSKQSNSEILKVKF